MVTSSVSIYIYKHLLKYGYDDNLSQLNMHFISSNDLSSMSVFLNTILYEASAYRGCSKCDRLDHISSYNFILPINVRTLFLLFGGIMFTMDFTFIFIGRILFRFTQNI